MGWSEPGERAVEPTAGAGGGTSGCATGRQYSGGLRGLGGDAGGVSVAGPSGGDVGASARAPLGRTVAWNGCAASRWGVVRPRQHRVGLHLPPGIAGLGPLSSLRQHGLVPTLRVLDPRPGHPR